MGVFSGGSQRCRLPAFHPHPSPVQHAKTQLLTDSFQVPIRGRAHKQHKSNTGTKNIKRQRAPKDPRPKHPPQELEQRRKYDRSRNQSPERKEYHRQRRRQDRQTARKTGKCRGCPNPSLPNSGRCQACTEKHRNYSAARRARQKSERDLSKQAHSQTSVLQVPPAEEESNKAMRKCKHCSQTAIPGQTRCEYCAEKHRISRRKNDKARRARQKVERQLASIARA